MSWVAVDVVDCWSGYVCLIIIDFVRDWRFGFGFERWDFVVVCGLILACGYGGGGGYGLWFVGVWVAVVVDVTGSGVGLLFVHK